MFLKDKWDNGQTSFHWTQTAMVLGFLAYLQFALGPYRQFQNWQIPYGAEVPIQLIVAILEIKFIWSKFDQMVPIDNIQFIDQLTKAKPVSSRYRFANMRCFCSRTKQCWSRRELRNFDDDSRSIFEGAGKTYQRRAERKNHW